MRVLTTSVGPLLVGIGVVGRLDPTNIVLLLIVTFYFGWAGYRIQFVLHDCSHRSLFSSRKLNDIVGTFSGLLVGSNLARYREVHVLHHRFNGTSEDPQLTDYPPAKKLGRWGMTVFLVAPLFGSRVFKYLKRDMFAPSVQGKPVGRPNVVWLLLLICTQLLILVVITRLGQNLHFGIAYYLGLGTVALFLARLRALAEHQQIGSGSPDFTRSHRRNWIDFLVLCDANFCYHLEHHRWPSIQSRHYHELYQTANSDTAHTNISFLKQTMIYTIVTNFRASRTELN